MDNNKKQNNAQELDFNPFGKQKNIQVSEDKERDYVLLKIYGSIEEPSEYIEELDKLDLLSKHYDVLEITLNSPGGSLNTAVDIVSIINNFSYVITIGKGEVASAAFMIWTMGDVRVVTDYSMYMAHRESYGMYGKTSEHRDAAKTFGKVYEEMFENCFGDLLTDDEKMIADRSEAWISYKDLLERDRVIGFEDYIQPANPYSIAELYVTEKGKMFLYDPNALTYKSVELTYGDEELSDMTEYLYGITKISKIPKPTKVAKPTKIRKPVVDISAESEEEKPEKKTKKSPKKEKNVKSTKGKDKKVKKSKKEEDKPNE